MRCFHPGVQQRAGVLQWSTNVCAFDGKLCLQLLIGNFHQLFLRVTAWVIIKTKSSLKSHQEAYAHMAAMCFAKGWKLFRLRPKLHFQQHLTLLMGKESGSIAFSALSLQALLELLNIFCGFVEKCF